MVLQCWCFYSGIFAIWSWFFWFVFQFNECFGKVLGWSTASVMATVDTTAFELHVTVWRRHHFEFIVSGKTKKTIMISFLTNLFMLLTKRSKGTMIHLIWEFPGSTGLFFIAGFEFGNRSLSIHLGDMMKTYFFLAKLNTLYLCKKVC